MREHPLIIIKSSPKFFHGFGKILISGQSAGNLTKGSSETTCKASSPNFSADFLYWFIGFTEGAGSFIFNQNGYLEFKITQSSHDAQILFYIKKNLGFGTVSKHDSFHHFRVRDQKSLFKIIQIFNGNFLLHHSLAQFSIFVNSYNKTYSASPYLSPVLDSCVNSIKLDNTWLLGFTDAEGSFTISEISNPAGEDPQITVRFVISPRQEEDNFLQDLANVLKGRVSREKSRHNMTVNISNLEKTITYFKNNKLKTKKLLSYKKWLKIYEIVKAKEHLVNPEVMKKIREYKEKNEDIVRSYR
jgi:hypothetical protein